MRKLLIADDEYLVRETLKMVLGNIASLTVVGEAYSGKTAINLINIESPDITFLDINLPGVDIFELIKYIKEANSNHIIILLADYGSMDTVEKAIEAGADSYLMKPSRPKEIIDIVNFHIPLDQFENESLEQMVEQFIKYIFDEDYKSTKTQLRRITLYLITLYGNHGKSASIIAQSIVEKLKSLCRQKRLFISKNVNWLEKTRNLDTFTFESTIAAIVSEIFEELIDSRTMSDKKVIQSVLNFIEKNYQNGVTLEEAAEHVHLSSFYLSRLFKKELNVNFVSYVMERKIEKAKELLESTDMPVLNIALELNYKEPNYFSKVFKKVTGMTPSDYRKEKEKEKEATEFGLFQRNNQILNGHWFI